MMNGEHAQKKNDCRIDVFRFGIIGRKPEKPLYQQAAEAGSFIWDIPHTS